VSIQSDAFSKPEPLDNTQKAEVPPDFLTPQERRDLQRNLGFPEDLPREFKSWMLDYISTNGLEIPVSQLRGFTGFQPKIGLAADTSDTDSGTYVDVGGAELTDIGAGSYLFLFGYQRSDIVSGGGAGYMSPAFDGAGASDGAAAVTWGSTLAGATYFTTHSFGSGTHTAKLYARTDSGARRDFAGSWIIALKMGN
jgi:hypothetical protein